MYGYITEGRSRKINTAGNQVVTERNLFGEEIPCIKCHGIGEIGIEGSIVNPKEDCSHCNGTGIEPLFTMPSGYSGPIPPINMGSNT